MTENNCPYCGAFQDYRYMITTWKCETSQDNQGLYQSEKCIWLQHDQLIKKVDQLEARLKEAEELLHRALPCIHYNIELREAISRF